MKQWLAVLFLLTCYTKSMAATNAVSNTIIHDKIDLINTDMQQKYRLPLRADKDVILTGYTVQDVFTKINQTYSVIHVNF